jgi:hypothetical protein
MAQQVTIMKRHVRFGAGFRFRSLFALAAVLSSYELASAQDDGVVDLAAPPQSQASTSNETFGEAPPDYSHEFLRQESVLLKPGQHQLDIGLNYTVDDHPYTLLNTSNSPILPVDTLERRRLLIMPLQFRYGLTKRVQGFVDMPVGWTNTQVSFTGTDIYYNSGGLGDTSLGFSYMLHKSGGLSQDPDIIATFGITAPTSNTNILSAIFWTPETMLGQGVWAGSWNVLFVHTYDPVILFYGFGSRHAFAREFEDYDVRPGDLYLYRAGVGFAVTERVTFSSMLQGYYITQAELDGQQIPGTSREPIYLRFAATVVQRSGRICEPFAEIGMTNDAANTRFGITWTF